MTCQELTEFLADYIEGTLAAPMREAFEKHLSLCADCRRYLDGYRQSITTAQSAMRTSAPKTDIPEELIAAILQARRDAR